MVLWLILWALKALWSDFSSSAKITSQWYYHNELCSNLADYFSPHYYQLFSKIKTENVHIFWARRISQLMTSHTKNAHYWIWITIETASGICFRFLVFVHELNQIPLQFNMPASTGWTRGEWMLDADQERSRWWPSILVLHLHSGSVGPASLVDVCQFYKIIQYIIIYMYMYFNQPSNVSILGRHKLAPPPSFVFGKIVPSGLKMRAEHSSI